MSGSFRMHQARTPTNSAWVTRMQVLLPCILGASLGLAVAPSPAATVTFYDSFAAFDAVVTTTLRADFEGFSRSADTPGIPNPYTEGGVTFSNPSNLYVAASTGAAVAVGDIEFPITSNVLTVSGNEDILMSFGGLAARAMGFDSFTNRFAAPVVSVYDLDDLLIGSYVLTQGTNSAGFVGITADVVIGSVRWLATGGNIKDTAIDNIRVGARTIPEPATWALVLLCLAALPAAAGLRACE